MPGFVIHLAIAKEYLKRHKDDQEDEIPKEIQEIVKFEEGEPIVLTTMGTYNFIKGYAEDLKKLTDGPVLIRKEIEFLETRD